MCALLQRVISHCGSQVPVIRRRSPPYLCAAAVFSGLLLVIVVTVACIVAMVRKAPPLMAAVDGRNQSWQNPVCDDKRSLQVSCELPRKTTIFVREGQPTNEMYTPPVTVLHRCTYDTGCCEDESQVCGVGTTEMVTLPFWVRRDTAQNKTEYFEKELTFVNHTLCRCIADNGVETNSAEDVDLLPTRHRCRLGRVANLEPSREKARMLAATLPRRLR